MQNLVAFHNDGSVEYTRNTELDFLFDGQGQMQRVTEICKESGRAQYYIKWLMGPLAGAMHRWEHSLLYRPLDLLLDDWVDCVGPAIPSGLNWERRVMYFPTYEAAVAHEVTVLNAMRSAGIKIHEEAQ